MDQGPPIYFDASMPTLTDNLRLRFLRLASISCFCTNSDRFKQCNSLSAQLVEQKLHTCESCGGNNLPDPCHCMIHRISQPSQQPILAPCFVATSKLTRRACGLPSCVFCPCPTVQSPIPSTLQRASAPPQSHLTLGGRNALQVTALPLDSSVDTTIGHLLWDDWNRELATPVQPVDNSLCFLSEPGFVKSRSGHVRPRGGIEAVSTRVPASLRKFENKDIYSLNTSINSKVITSVGYQS